MTTSVEQAAGKVTDWFFATQDKTSKPLDETTLQKLWQEAKEQLPKTTDLSENDKTAALKIAFERILAGTQRPLKLESHVRIRSGDTLAVLPSGSIFKAKETWINNLKDGRLDVSDINTYQDQKLLHADDLLPHFLSAAYKVHRFRIDNGTKENPAIATLCTNHPSLEFCKGVKTSEKKVSDTVADRTAATMFIGAASETAHSLEDVLLKEDPTPTDMRNNISSIQIQQITMARIGGLLAAGGLLQTNFLLDTYRGNKTKPSSERNKLLVSLLASPEKDPHGIKAPAREKLKGDVVKDGNPLRIALLSKSLDEIVEGAVAPTIAPAYDSVYQEIKNKLGHTLDVSSLAEMRGLLVGIPPRQARAIIERSIQETEHLSITFSGNNREDFLSEFEEWKKIEIDLPAIIAAKSAAAMYPAFKKFGFNPTPDEFRKIILLTYPNAPLWMLNDIHN